MNEQTQLHSLADLVKARDEKRAVVNNSNYGWQAGVPRPAAWVINLSGDRLYHILKYGLFIYTKPVKTK